MVLGIMVNNSRELLRSMIDFPAIVCNLGPFGINGANETPNIQEERDDLRAMASCDEV